MFNPLLEPVIERIEYLEYVVKMARQSLQNAPQGKLRCSRRKNKTAYFQMTDRKTQNGVYLGKDSYKTVLGLAKKDYDMKVLKTAEEEMKALRRLLHLYEKGRSEEVYEKMSEVRKELVIPLKLTDEEYIRDWENAQFNQKDNRDGRHRYTTAKGELVCSKSEVIIADTITYLGGHYRYEQEIYLRGLGIVHCDFYCTNERTRKDFIWEHEGMMDDPGYAATAIQRENAYFENGYYPGENLIITRETSEFPLDTEQVKEIVRKFLI